MNSRIRPFVFIGLIFLLQSAYGAEKAHNHSGHLDFESHCGSCHGKDGKGHGPMAAELKRQPADLTLLSKKNGGAFPYLEIRRHIDGQADQSFIRSHGNHEMPVWGRVFRGERGIVDGRQSSPMGHAYAKLKILNVVDYLASIQIE